MWSTIVGGISSFVGNLLTGLYKWAAALFAALYAKWKGRAKHAEHVLDKKDRQAEVDARPDLHRDQLLDRMRDRPRDDG